MGLFSTPFSVERSVQTEKDLPSVFASVADFANWRKWSPWLCQEPQCKVAIDGKPAATGHKQSWDGEIIGSGQITITAVTPNERLDYDLLFLKPWKSKSTSNFEFSTEGNSTNITWRMHGELPLFLFYLKKMMIAYIGHDYERGLAMLKEYLETGNVPSETVIKDVDDRATIHYVGKRRSCALADVATAMQEDFAELQNLPATDAKPTGAASIYYKHDLVGSKCEYSACLLYEKTQPAPDGFVSGSLPQHRALRVDHRGPYRHLGNAWATAIRYVQATKLKQSKTTPMYEIYANDPRETPETDIKTEIYIPIKR